MQKSFVRLFPLALLVSTCSTQSPDLTAEEQTRPVQFDSTHDCPVFQLSCGHQIPQRSNGKTPFINEDMQISAIFSAGTFVCLSRSGDSPRGFYTHYRGSDNICVENHDTARFIGVSASFNSPLYTDLDQAAGHCAPIVDRETQKHAELALKQVGYPAIACQMRFGGVPSGFTLYSFANTLDKQAPETAIIYMLFFRSPRATAETDLLSFYEFLKNLKIGNPKKTRRN